MVVLLYLLVVLAARCVTEGTGHRVPAARAPRPLSQTNQAAAHIESGEKGVRAGVRYFPGVSGQRG